MFSFNDKEMLCKFEGKTKSKLSGTNFEKIDFGLNP